eukprot:g19272.t1
MVLLSAAALATLAAGNGFCLYRFLFARQYHAWRLETAADLQALVLPSFRCPISQEVMRDPVVTCDGQTYEHQNIQEWFRRGTQTSPLTNLPLASKELVPNLALRQAVADFHTKVCPLLQEELPIGAIDTRWTTENALRAECTCSSNARCSCNKRSRGKMASAMRQRHIRPSMPGLTYVARPWSGACRMSRVACRVLPGDASLTGLLARARGRDLHLAERQGGDAQGDGGPRELAQQREEQQKVLELLEAEHAVAMNKIKAEGESLRRQRDNAVRRQWWSFFSLAAGVGISMIF